MPAATLEGCPSNEPTLVANSPARQAGHPSRSSPPGIPRRMQAGQTVLPINKQATLNSPPVSEPQAGTHALSVNFQAANGKADILIVGREDGHTSLA